MTFYKQKQLPKRANMAEPAKPGIVQFADKYVSDTAFESLQLIKRLFYTTRSAITFSQIRATCVYGFLLLGITIQGLAITTPYFNPWNTRPIIYTLYGTYWSLLQGSQFSILNDNVTKQVNTFHQKNLPVPLENWSTMEVAKLLPSQKEVVNDPTLSKSLPNVSTMVRHSYLKNVLLNWPVGTNLELKNNFTDKVSLNENLDAKQKLYTIAKQKVFEPYLPNLPDRDFGLGKLSIVENLVSNSKVFEGSVGFKEQNPQNPFTFYQKQNFIQEIRASFNKNFSSSSYFSNVPEPVLPNTFLTPRITADYNMELQQNHGFPFRSRPAAVALKNNADQIIIHGDSNVLFTYNPLSLSNEVYKYYHSLAPISQRVDKFLLFNGDKKIFQETNNTWQQTFLARVAVILPWCGPICAALLIHSAYEIFGGYFFEKFGQGPLQRYSLDKYVLWPQYNTLSLTINKDKNNNFGMLNSESYSLLECLGKSATTYKKNKISDFNRRKGTLLIGSGESGKFAFAQAVAGEAFVPFIFIPANRFATRSLDETLLLVQIIFYIGQKISPCVLYFEDIQSFCQVRSSLDIPNESRNTKRMVTQYKDGQNSSIHENLSAFTTNRYQTFFQSLRATSIHSKFISAFEKLRRLPSNSSSGGSGPTLNRVNANQVVLLNHFLVKLEKCLASSFPILVLASTPRLNLLDPALVRPGRLSYHLFFEPLSYHGRKNMLNSILSRQGATTEFPIGFLSDQLAKFDRNGLQKYVMACLLRAYLYSPQRLKLPVTTFKTKHVTQASQSMESSFSTKSDIADQIPLKWYKEFSNMSLFVLQDSIHNDFLHSCSVFDPSGLISIQESKLTGPVNTFYSLLQSPTSTFSLYLVDQLWVEGSAYLKTGKYADLLFYMAKVFSLIPTRLITHSQGPFQYSAELPDAYSSIQLAMFKNGALNTGTRTIESLEESTNQSVKTQWVQNYDNPSAISDRALLTTNLLIEYHAWLYFQFYHVVNIVDKGVCSHMEESLE
uniref:Cell division protein n=1 Tax=prasinophyte sp. MBIC10622 TaxID=156113 RepID=A0A088CIS3_9CHLO|nr:cell division protein [prasinophyte sp. MBIC10622]